MGTGARSLAADLNPEVSPGWDVLVLLRRVPWHDRHQAVDAGRKGESREVRYLG